MEIVISPAMRTTVQRTTKSYEVPIKKARYMRFALTLPAGSRCLSAAQTGDNLVVYVDQPEPAGDKTIRVTLYLVGGKGCKKTNRFGYDELIDTLVVDGEHVCMYRDVSTRNQ